MKTNYGRTCGPDAYGRYAERVEQVARTSGEGGVLRGKRFAFMTCDCVAAVEHSCRNLRAFQRPMFCGRFLQFERPRPFTTQLTCSN